jgi:hypothetical protein
MKHLINWNAVYNLLVMIWVILFTKKLHFKYTQTHKN